MALSAPKICARCGEQPAIAGRPGPYRCAKCAAAPRQPTNRHRRRTVPRARTRNRAQLRLDVWRENQLTSRSALADILAAVPRPQTRGDCTTCPVCAAHLADPTPAAVLSCGHVANLAVNRCRPCVRVGCRHHVFLDVDPVRGSIKFNYPHLEPGDLTNSCSLDIADSGPQILERVAAAMNLTRERSRQVELGALAAVAGAARRLL